MRRGGAAVLAALILSTSAQAQSPERRVVEGTGLAPTSTIRPEARPGGTPVPPVGTGGAAAATVAAAAVPQLPNRPSGPATALAIAQSLRPSPRPDGLEARVRASATRNTPGRVTQPGSNSGTLCGVVGLQGDQIEPVTGRISGCGIQNAVRLRVVHGVPLTQPATINCTTAQAVSAWMLDAAEIVGNTGGGISSIRVLASYACRTRNSQRGARLSEHAVGNAIDIGGLGLANGEELSVLDDWRSNQSQIMRDLHSAACGTFGTVLGPNSDRFHQDHFHFDVASYRSGSYCR